MARSMAGTREQIRRRVSGWRAAERRERALQRSEGPMAPADALAAALELAALNPTVLLASDAVRARETDAARAAWRRLRRRLAWPPENHPIP
jgi:hypothetical protein